MGSSKSENTFFCWSTFSNSRIVSSIRFLYFEVITLAQSFNKRLNTHRMSNPFLIEALKQAHTKNTLDIVLIIDSHRICIILSTRMQNMASRFRRNCNNLLPFCSVAKIKISSSLRFIIQLTINWDRTINFCIMYTQVLLCTSDWKLQITQCAMQSTSLMDPFIIKSWRIMHISFDARAPFRMLTSDASPSDCKQIFFQKISIESNFVDIVLTESLVDFLLLVEGKCCWLPARVWFSCIFIHDVCLVDESCWWNIIFSLKWFASMFKQWTRQEKLSTPAIRLQPNRGAGLRVEGCLASHSNRVINFLKRSSSSISVGTVLLRIFLRELKLGCLLLSRWPHDTSSLRTDVQLILHFIFAL